MREMSAATQERVARIRGRADAFNDTMLELLEHVEYRLATGGEDLEAIYQLRYRSYLRAGMIGPNAEQMLRDRWDDLPNCYRFGVYYDGELVSTVRIHHLTRQNPYSPSAETYPAALAERLKTTSFVDVTRFTAATEKAPSPNALPFLTLRLVVVASTYFGGLPALVPVKLEHASFYHRIFNVHHIAEPVTFPNLQVPMALFEAPAGENLRGTIERFPFFRSTPIEQRMLFGSLPVDRDPLTVLPTAKYVRRAA